MGIGRLVDRKSRRYRRSSASCLRWYCPSSTGNPPPNCTVNIRLDVLDPVQMRLLPNERHLPVSLSACDITLYRLWLISWVPA